MWFHVVARQWKLFLQVVFHLQKRFLVCAVGRPVPRRGIGSSCTDGVRRAHGVASMDCECNEKFHWDAPVWSSKTWIGASD